MKYHILTKNWKSSLAKNTGSDLYDIYYEDTHENMEGALRVSDWKALAARHDEEMAAALATDSTGLGFIFDALSYELANHEYRITLDPSAALAALGLSWADVEASPALAAGFKKAEKEALGIYTLETKEVKKVLEAAVSLRDDQSAGHIFFDGYNLHHTEEAGGAIVKAKVKIKNSRRL